MDNERAKQRMDDHSVSVVGVSISVLPEYCLCGMPYCHCGHFEVDSYGSVAMCTLFDQRITTTELKKSKH